MPQKFAFLPNVRTALAGRSEPPAAGGTRRRVRLGVQPLADGDARGVATIEHVVELVGAAEITSIDNAAIPGIEPKPSPRGVEPNYFPYVEFTDADFPWRHSLDTRVTPRLKPWLVLIALEADEFRFLDRSGGPLRRIEVFNPSASLPDLEQSWAFAHVQVNTSLFPSSTVDDLLAKTPNAHFARLMCPRRLADNTSYYLFLVPAYDGGRRRGLGDKQPASPWDAPAWGPAATTAAQLPVYRHWSFQTSSLEDFETLARRLVPFRADAASGVGGTRTIYAGQPGYYADVRDPSLSFECEGALCRIGFARNPALIQQTPILKRLAATLSAQVLSDNELDAGQAAEDPLVALPAWGHRFARVTSIDPTATSKRWVHETNLDHRLRFAAGSGARVVRKNQEPFMTACWEQVGAIREANAARARLHLAERLTKGLVKKHLQSLPVAVSLTLTRSCFDLVRTGSRTISVNAELTALGVPAGFADGSLRRIAAKRPVMGGGLARISEPGVIGAATRVGVVSGVRGVRPAVRTRATVADPGHVIAARLPAALRVMSGAPRQPRIEVGKVNARAVVDAVVTVLEGAPLAKARFVVQGISTAEAGGFDQIMRAPRIPDPLAGRLEPEDSNVFIPNAANIPDNSVLLLEENRPFIEGLLVGANHEMNEELRWREFPTDMRGTVFGRFWDRGADLDDVAADDVKPLHTWTGSSGTHFLGPAAPNVVAVICGDIVRRFPNLVMVANRQVIPAGGKWLATRGTTWQSRFSGRFGDSIAYFGFDLSSAVLRAHIAEFYLVLLEPAGRYRFGLDIRTHAVRSARADLSAAPIPFPTLALQPVARGAVVRNVNKVWGRPVTPAGPTVASFDDLSWSHVTLTSSAYIDFTKTIQIQSAPGAWGPDRDSASLAEAMLQKPVCVVVPARRLIPNA